MLLLGRASLPKLNSTQSESWQPQLVPDAHHKWHTDTICESDLVEAQDVGLKFYYTFSCGDVHIGEILAENIARVVEHDQTTLYDRL